MMASLAYHLPNLSAGAPGAKLLMVNAGRRCEQRVLFIRYVWNERRWHGLRATVQGYYFVSAMQSSTFTCIIR